MVGQEGLVRARVWGVLEREVRAGEVSGREAEVMGAETEEAGGVERGGGWAQRIGRPASDKSR